MTIDQFARQTYWYPILWYLFATIVAFTAAILFWKRGSSTAEGKVPSLPVTWKFTGAGAIFVVVLLVFFVINPLKPFSTYKKLLIVYSNQDEALSPAAEGTPVKIDQTIITADDKSVPFDPATLHVQMIPADSVYDLTPELTDNAFRTKKSIPRGMYTVRVISSATGKSKEFLLEVK